MKTQTRWLNVFKIDYEKPPTTNKHGNLIYEAEMSRRQYEDTSIRFGTVVAVAAGVPGVTALMIIVGPKNKVEHPYSWDTDFGEQEGVDITYTVEVTSVSWQVDSSFL